MSLEDCRGRIKMRLGDFMLNSATRKQHVPGLVHSIRPEAKRTIATSHGVSRDSYAVGRGRSKPL